MDRKFTLTELICTISIIVILIAIVAPIFAKVKGTAQGAGCVSQLRSLGLGFSLYCAENRNYLPHHDDGTDVPPSGFIWYKKVMPYLSGEDSEGVKYRQEAGYEYETNDITKTVFSYKMNSRLEDYKGSKSFYSPHFRSVSSIAFPSRTVLIFDGRADKTPFNFQPYGPPTSVHARHAGKAGILFMDWTSKLIEGNTDENGFWLNDSGLIWDPDSENYK